MLIATTIQTRITFTCLDAEVECVTKEISELESQLYGSVYMKAIELVSGYIWH
jgi:hypothetical protein